MPSDFVGKWECVQSDSDHAEALLKELGCNMIKRKAAKSIKPDTEINNHGDKWTIKVTSTFANNNLDFKMGVPTKYETLDGRHVEGTFTMEGEDTIVEVQHWDGKTCKTVRKLHGKDKLVITTTAGAATLEAVFKRKSG